jgi:hypothetical protein
MVRGMRPGENNNLTGSSSTIHKTILTSGVQVRLMRCSEPKQERFHAKGFEDYTDDIRSNGFGYDGCGYNPKTQN